MRIPRPILTVASPAVIGSAAYRLRESAGWVRHARAQTRGPGESRVLTRDPTGAAGALDDEYPTTDLTAQCARRNPQRKD